MKKLRAGDLDVFLDGTQLRYIQTNGVEVLRGIYATLRNENWDTIIPEVSVVSLTEDSNAFNVEMKAVYRNDTIHFEANFIYEGRTNSQIECVFHGKAFSTFKRNRIGFCVLHPLKECIGKEVILNNSERHVFPDLISPHQPFFNVKSMRWSPLINCQAELAFEGDIFETEDQRNWTDASYKTYCTPLGIPFPVLVNAGEMVSQRILLKFESTSDAPFKKVTIALRLPQFATKVDAIHSSIGLGISTDRSGLTEQEITLLKSTTADHLRIDIVLFKSNWQQEWKRSVEHSEALGWKLELVLHFSENYVQEANDFLKNVGNISSTCHSILLLKYRKTGLPTDEQQFLIESFRTVIPGVKLGIGTDAYFAELNRENLDVSNVDFVGFSINPQVHAFDDLSLIETLEAQLDVIRSVKEKFGNIPVHIHSITLKPRFNPNATIPNEAGYPLSDDRQNTMFCYQWTRESINILQKAGVASITYFETVGLRGIMDGERFPVLEAFIPVTLLNEKHD